MVLDLKDTIGLVVQPFMNEEGRGEHCTVPMKVLKLVGDVMKLSKVRLKVPPSNELVSNVAFT
jgi:hypothetical protein